jgi:hypothetical protein
MARCVIPAAAVAAAAAIVTAGCASAGASGPGALTGAAAVVPASTVEFVAASTDLASSRWHGLAQPLLEQFRAYQSALGDEIDVAVLPGKQVVALTQPSDATKLAALAAKRGAKTRRIGDWTAIASTDAALDAVAGATSHLADSNLFIAAMARLPGDALVRAYANGDEAAQLMASLPGQLQTTSVPGGARFRYTPSRPQHTPYAATTQFKWAAAALTSESGGLRIQAIVRQAGLVAPGPARLIIHPTPPYRSALVDEIPADALAVADFVVAPGTFETAPLPKQLQQAFGAKAPLVPGELDTLLGGETAIYVRPGAPIPEVTLVTQPADTAATGNALNSLLAALPANVPLHGVKLVRTSIGGQFVASTSQAGIEAFRNGGAKLADDPTFMDAEKRAGMGATTTGFVYGNVEALLPMLQLAGMKLPQGLPSVGSLLAYGARADGDSTFTAFLGVG